MGAGNGFDKTSSEGERKKLALSTTGRNQMRRRWKKGWKEKSHIHREGGISSPPKNSIGEKK